MGWIALALIAAAAGLFDDDEILEPTQVSPVPDSRILLDWDYFVAGHPELVNLTDEEQTDE